MTLIKDLQEYYKGQSYPPDGSEVDAEQVSYEVVDDSPRWGSVIEVVYKRGGTYVAVRDVEPATEEQSWGDYGEPEVFEVVPEEVVVVKYNRVIRTEARNDDHEELDRAEV